MDPEAQKPDPIRRHIPIQLIYGLEVWSGSLQKVRSAQVFFWCNFSGVQFLSVLYVGKIIAPHVFIKHIQTYISLEKYQLFTCSSRKFTQPKILWNKIPLRKYNKLTMICLNEALPTDSSGLTQYTIFKSWQLRRGLSSLNNENRPCLEVAAMTLQFQN